VNDEGATSTVDATTGATLSSQEDHVSTAWRALATVCDPELYLDVVALGFIYGVREVNGAIEVEMTLTTPGCPASQSIPEIARDAIDAALGGTVPVHVNIVWEPRWSPKMIDVEAAAAKGFGVRS
jgi:metal-sulfur cluster biosynthetic enzyme